MIQDHVDSGRQQQPLSQFTLKRRNEDALRPLSLRCAFEKEQALVVLKNSYNTNGHEHYHGHSIFLSGKEVHFCFFLQKVQLPCVLFVIIHSSMHYYNIDMIYNIVNCEYCWRVASYEIPYLGRRFTTCRLPGTWYSFLIYSLHTATARSTIRRTRYNRSRYAPL